MILSQCLEREVFTKYSEQYIWIILPERLSINYINLQLSTLLHIGEVKIVLYYYCIR